MGRHERAMSMGKGKINPMSFLAAGFIGTNGCPMPKLPELITVGGACHAGLQPVFVVLDTHLAMSAVSTVLVCVNPGNQLGMEPTGLWMQQLVASSIYFYFLRFFCRFPCHICPEMLHTATCMSWLIQTA